MKINNSEGGEEKTREFIASLVVRAKVPEGERAAEEERLEKMILDRIFEEALATLPQEELDEMQKSLDETGDFSEDKIYAAMFKMGVKPESIVSKVLREIEREYLGAENVESEETLIEAEEEKDAR
ncbi:hypothetical protein IKE71_02120 [Candidatus Saccharibacteria bacterium]|nr:hypothetical protein [Candidatus Saccharibacteria bacterium]